MKDQSALSETEVIHSVLKGNTEAFSVLVVRYWPTLFRYLHKMGASREDAEELAQEAFLRAYTKLGSYREKWRFSTWLFRIAVHAWRDANRRSKRTSVDLADLLETPSPLPGPEDSAMHHSDALACKQMLGKLTMKSRSMLVLHYHSGLTLAEIGQILGMSEAAVKMGIMRARNSLSAMREPIGSPAGEENLG